VRFQELQQLQQEIQNVASNTQAEFHRKTDTLTQELLDFDVKPGNVASAKTSNNEISDKV
jgi:hypothetical protein